MKFKYGFFGFLLIFALIISSCSGKKTSNIENSAEQNTPQENTAKVNDDDLWFAAAGGEVRVTIATDEILSRLNDYFDVTEEYAPYSQNIVFTAGAELHDFRYIEIELDFEHEPVRIIERSVMGYLNMSPEDALVVSWTDAGTMPRAGISFIDENNQRRYFAIIANHADPEEGGTAPILLAEYPGVSNTEVNVYVRQATPEILSKYSSYSEFIDNNTGAYEKLVFTANNAVKDFWYIEIGHNDEPFFLTFESVLYSCELLPELPFVVTLTELSRIPQRGISYIDENNSRRFFYISEDGMVNNVYHLSGFQPH
ncbi:MAG: hypothetical protein FWD40_06610 [Treponema sp.]|nr:hypothetical protein [Treponema sp.]